MRYAFTLSAYFVALATPACAQSTSQRSAKLDAFPHAFAMRGCTQEDAPALEIYLTRAPYSGEGDPAAPYLRVEISSSPSETIAAGSFNLIQMRRDPAKPGRVLRAELVESRQNPIWLSGTIVLNEAIPGGRVSGRYSFSAPDGRQLDSSFTAQYSTRSAVCG